MSDLPNNVHGSWRSNVTSRPNLSALLLEVARHPREGSGKAELPISTLGLLERTSFWKVLAFQRAADFNLKLPSPRPEIRIENQALQIGVIGKLLERIAFLHSSLRVLDSLTSIPENFKCGGNVIQDGRIIRR